MVRTLFPRVLWRLCAALFVLLPSCNCDETLDTLEPEIVVNPLQIDFGPRPIGEVATATLSIGNEGEAPLILGGFRFADMRTPDDTFYDTSGVAFAAPEPADRVPVGETVDVTITFSPIGQGLFGGTVFVQSDDKDEPEVAVDLLGEGGAPLIEAIPATLDFGRVNEGPGSRQQVQLHNVGYGRLNVSDVFLESSETLAPTVFSLEAGAPSDFSIVVDGTEVVGVRMDPTSAAYEANGFMPHTDALIVQSDALNEPRLRIPLVGDVNRAPVAVAVEKITREQEIKVGVGREVTIDGSDTTEPDGDAFSYTWTLVESPANDAVLYQGIPGATCTDDAQCDLANGYRCVAGSTTKCRQVAETNIVPSLPGTYVVRLRATDALGAYGEADAVILPRDFGLVLRWSPQPGSACTLVTEEECDDLPANQQVCPCDQNDLDLHFIGPAYTPPPMPGPDAGPADAGLVADAGPVPDGGLPDVVPGAPDASTPVSGGFCDLGTCPGSCTGTMQVDGGPQVFNWCVEPTNAHVDTCRSYGADCSTYNRYPEWGMPGRSDDPRLDVDDVRGAGPEITTLNNPADGSYTAVVHYYLDRIGGEPTEATLEVYVKGELQLTVGPQLMNEGDVWYALNMERSGGPVDGTWDFTPLAPVALDLGTDVCGY